jgi:hypothetical protein
MHLQVEINKYKYLQSRSYDHVVTGSLVVNLSFHRYVPTRKGYTLIRKQHYMIFTIQVIVTLKHSANIYLVVCLFVVLSWFKNGLIPYNEKVCVGFCV